MGDKSPVRGGRGRLGCLPKNGHIRRCAPTFMVSRETRDAFLCMELGIRQ